MYSRIYWAVLAVCLISIVLFFGMGCDNDDDKGGEIKLVVNNSSEYEYSNLWVVIHDPVTDSVLQVFHFTEPGSHEIPNVPSIFTLTLVQREYGMARISTFANVKRQVWNLSPLIFFAFPYGEVMLQVDLPEDSIERVTATLPGSFSVLDVELDGENWAYGSLGHLIPPSGKQNLLVIARGQDQCYANWLMDQTFTGEFDFRSISVDRLAHKQALTLSTSINSLYVLGYNSDNGRWPYIFEAIEDMVQFTECDLVIPDFPVEDHWLYVGTDDDVRMSYFQKFSTLPDEMTIPQKSMTFGFMDSVQVNDVAINGIVDAIAASWSASSFEHSVMWTVYAPGSSESIARPSLPDSVIQSVGVWADFEPWTLNVYDYQPATSWDQFVYYVARGSSIYENGLSGAYQLTYRLYEHTSDAEAPETVDWVSQQLAIMPQ